MPSARPRLALAAGITLAVVATPLLVTAQASASAGGLVVSEVYGGGGNTGAPFRSDFVELHNTSGSPVSLAGMSVQYRSASGTGTGVTPLSGTIPAGAHWLVEEAAGASTTAAELPTPDATGTLALSAGSGIVFLASTTSAVAPGDASVVDLVGYGSATSYEGSGAAPALGNATSASRAASGADTDDNAADLTAGAPGPQASGGGGSPTPEPAPVDATIAEIQGTGPTSPLAGRTVATQGVVTASYPTGGLRGFTLQTAGTGGAVDLATHHASDAVFVYLGSAPAASYPSIGDHVAVQGGVSEFGGLTELTPGSSGSVTALATPAAAVRPATVTWPGTEDRRESLESMLLAPRGHYTVTDNYSLNRYAEVGLARGRTPLRQPTDVARPGAAAAAVAARNAERRLALDDGATIDFLPFGGGAGQDVPLPYLTRQPVRVGAAVTFTRPVVLDRRNDAWKLQPTRQVTATNGADPVSFARTRPARPDRVGGNVRIASFNVLNYFPETGADWVAAGGTCSFYDDRDGDHVTVDSCSGDGPRGAAEDDDLARQQAKIVRAINTLGADVLSLEEIENSAKHAGPAHRDDALATLVRALNADLGRTVWAYVPSPATRPAVAEEDVIRTAFIYRKKVARPVGTSRILVGDPAFASAREPLAQVFHRRGASKASDFLVVVDHFKSKGSGVDDGTGQGSSNPDRVAQAAALVRFTAGVEKATGTRRTFLVGDFNSYTREDPMQVLYDAGWTDLGARLTSESTYLFDGVVGSLDHVLANRAALRTVTGADVWNINSPESVAYEYSRHDYNATDFYAPDQFRASDHDPLLVGFRARR